MTTRFCESLARRGRGSGSRSQHECTVLPVVWPDFANVPSRLGNGQILETEHRTYRLAEGMTQIGI